MLLASTNSPTEIEFALSALSQECNFLKTITLNCNNLQTYDHKGVGVGVMGLYTAEQLYTQPCNVNTHSRAPRRQDEDGDRYRNPFDIWQCKFDFQMIADRPSGTQRPLIVGYTLAWSLWVTWCNLEIEFNEVCFLTVCMPMFQAWLCVAWPAEPAALVTGEFPSQRANNVENVLMTSSCSNLTDWLIQQLVPRNIILYNYFHCYCYDHYSYFVSSNIIIINIITIIIIININIFIIIFIIIYIIIISSISISIATLLSLSLLLLVSTWWRHQMETFSPLLAICAGNSPGTGEFPAQRPVTRSFDVFFDLRLNKRLSKQSWGWWFETR